jgi:hypothetical protein
MPTGTPLASLLPEPQQFDCAQSVISRLTALQQAMDKNPERFADYCRVMER